MYVKFQDKNLADIKGTVALMKVINVSKAWHKLSLPSYTLHIQWKF